MLNDTENTEAANVEYSLENVIAFPVKSARPQTFRVPASAVTSRFAPDSKAENSSSGVETSDDPLDIQRMNMIPDLCDVYMKEIYFKLHALGFDVMTEEFEKDMHFAYEALSSALYRMYGTHHPVQDFVDSNFVIMRVDENGTPIPPDPVTPTEPPEHT